MNFWHDTPDDFLDLKNESRVFFLHPWLRSYITDLKPEKILDFGSADGSLLAREDILFQELYLYDISKKMMIYAKENYGARPNVHFVTDSTALPQGEFDLVVCSLVLLTLASTEDFALVCSKISQSLKIGGRCIIADTHPCFRQYPFSTFSTSVEPDGFTYLKEGVPFTTTLTDYKGEHNVRFTDFHWPLSYTLNAFLEQGLQLKHFFELPDKAFLEKLGNINYPCYIVIDFLKSS